MADVQKKNQDLKEFLKKMTAFMIRSSESYDQDLLGEAPRLAVCIRALVQDTSHSRSVLTELGLKDRMFFYDNSPDYNPNLGMPFSGLAVVTIGGSSPRYLPRLGLNPNIPLKKVSFEAWWHKPAIVDPQKNFILNRELIVLSVANSNIGAVDSKLTGEFNELQKGIKEGWIKEGHTVPHELVSIMFASARQIAFELLNSLNEQHPEFFEIELKA